MINELEKGKKKGEEFETSIIKESEIFILTNQSENTRSQCRTLWQSQLQSLFEYPRLEG